MFKSLRRMPFTSGGPETKPIFFKAGNFSSFLISRYRTIVVQNHVFGRNRDTQCLSNAFGLGLRNLRTRSPWWKFERCKALSQLTHKFWFPTFFYKQNLKTFSIFLPKVWRWDFGDSLSREESWISPRAPLQGALAPWSRLSQGLNIKKHKELIFNPKSKVQQF